MKRTRGERWLRMAIAAGCVALVAAIAWAVAQRARTRIRLTSVNVAIVEILDEVTRQKQLFFNEAALTRLVAEAARRARVSSGEGSAVITDAWGNPIRVRFRNVEGGVQISTMSAGSDGDFADGCISADVFYPVISVGSADSDGLGAEIIIPPPIQPLPNAGSHREERRSAECWGYRGHLFEKRNLLPTQLTHYRFVMSWRFVARGSILTPGASVRLHAERQ